MYNIGDKIIAKKMHPCGGNCWTIIRCGADYKIKCDKCGRIVILSHDDLKKIIKSVVCAKEQSGDGR